MPLQCCKACGNTSIHWHPASCRKHTIPVFNIIYIDWYFSHMLNCLYDCRYCFLQGMSRNHCYFPVHSPHD